MTFSSKIYQGSVYFVQHREVTSRKSHFLVVVNPNPAVSDFIVFGVITSDIDSAYRRAKYNNEDKKTIVPLTTKDYPALSHDSVIDCNTPVKYSKSEFESIFGQLKTKQRINMPQAICDAILQGVLLSNQVQPRIKKSLQ